MHLGGVVRRDVDVAEHSAVGDGESRRVDQVLLVDGNVFSILEYCGEPLRNIADAVRSCFARDLDEGELRGDGGVDDASAVVVVSCDVPLGVRQLALQRHSELTRREQVGDELVNLKYQGQSDGNGLES